MPKQTITFRLDGQYRKYLDVIAATMDRDRSYVLNEAVAQYVEVHRWQLAHIEKGVKQADRGDFAGEAKVAAAFSKRRR